MDAQQWILNLPDLSLSCQLPRKRKVSAGFTFPFTRVSGTFACLTAVELGSMWRVSLSTKPVSTCKWPQNFLGSTAHCQSPKALTHDCFHNLGASEANTQAGQKRPSGSAPELSRPATKSRLESSGAGGNVDLFKTTMQGMQQEQQRRKATRTEAHAANTAHASESRSEQKLKRRRG